MYSSSSKQDKTISKMARAIKSKPAHYDTPFDSQSINLELQLQDLTLEMAVVKGVPGFKTCSGKGFISNRQLMDIIDDGSQHQDIGLGYRVPTWRLLQMVLACLNKLSVSVPSNRRRKKHKCYQKRPKPFNAYMHFNRTIRMKISTLMPDYKQKEVSKLTGALWKASNANTKAYHRCAAAKENKLDHHITLCKHHICPQSLHYKRSGSFVCFCNGCWCLSKLKGDITEVLNLKWISNMDPHVFRSVSDTSSCDEVSISRDTSFFDSLECSIGQEDCSSDLLSWLDSWNTTERLDIASDFVDWSSIMSDLSIYIGRIQDQHRLQLLESIILSDSDVNNAFKLPSADSDLWVPSIQAETKLEEF
ncbi:hypothetical protein INT43_004954 [Umbelopsis isabellina]|uniref:HMG box domain-containing protein n=1 Tax=Mortierella isabellina TaxID=91625 RepID=A0A8H7PEF2_MORIS|nr:hypothetical protein INT43_004954 [Umbelopsis isabellina]